MPRPSEAVRVARRAHRRAHRNAVHPGRRIAVLALVAGAAVVTVALAAFGSGEAARIETTVPAQASRLLPAGPPSPQVVALVDTLRIQLPVAQTRLTAIGYHGGTPGALGLAPVGGQANQGLFQRAWHGLVGRGTSRLHWYRLAGDGTEALDVGAQAGSDVYAPVDGVVVGLSKVRVDGRVLGARVEIQPSSAPSTVVVVTRLAADPALTVGSSVVAASSKIGTVVDFSKVERQALARFTNDAGNHVTLEVHPAATLAVP